MTPAQLVEAVKVSSTLAEFWTPHLNKAMEKYGIDTPARQAGFIAQASHESANFTRTVEDLSYRAERILKVWPSRFKTIDEAKEFERDPVKLGSRVYANRNGNGDEATGDGYRYRGRGLFQVTGKTNYVRVGLGIDLDLLRYPSLLEEPAAACESAAWWWMDADLNELADGGAIDAITRQINGPGMLGRVERAVAFQNGLTAFA